MIGKRSMLSIIALLEVLSPFLQEVHGLFSFYTSRNQRSCLSVLLCFQVGDATCRIICPARIRPCWLSTCPQSKAALYVVKMQNAPLMI